MFIAMFTASSWYIICRRRQNMEAFSATIVSGRQCQLRHHRESSESIKTVCRWCRKKICARPPTSPSGMDLSNPRRWKGKQAVEINYYLIYFVILYLTLRLWPHPTPSEEAPRGGVYSSTRMCIPFCILVPAGPHFPEFRKFRGLSGIPRSTRRNQIVPGQD